MNPDSFNIIPTGPINPPTSVPEDSNMENPYADFLPQNVQGTNSQPSSPGDSNFPIPQGVDASKIQIFGPNGELAPIVKESFGIKDEEETPEEPETPEETETSEETETPEGEETETPEGEETPEDEDEVEEPKNASPQAKNAFAELRRKNKAYQKELNELKEQVEQLKSGSQDSEKTKELESYVKGWAYKQLPEYKAKVSDLFDTGISGLRNICQSQAVDFPTKELNAIWLDGKLSTPAREDAFYDLAKQIGIPSDEVARFVLLSKRVDEAYANNDVFVKDADKYQKEFMDSLREKALEGQEQKKIEIDLTNYTDKHLKEVAEELGLELPADQVKDILKSARHSAHSIETDAFMKATLLPVALKQNKELQTKVQKLSNQIQKLRGSKPPVNGGKPASPKPATKTNKPTFNSPEDVGSKFFTF